MKAIWHDIVVAQAPKEKLIYIEGDWYFPAKAVNLEMLRKSPTEAPESWKGAVQYFDVGVGHDWSEDSAFSYPEPKDSAVDIVKKDFANYVAFCGDVQVAED